VLTTILGQATRFFDRRAIVSGFAPTALFWGLALAAGAAATRGWTGSLDWWTAQSGTAQTVLFTAAVVWLVIFGVLTVNWNVALVRLFEGYWPDSIPWRWLTRRFEAKWKRRWQALADQDTALEEQTASLRSELDRRGAHEPKLEQRLADLERQRQPISRKLFLYFPSSPEAVMPTRLGNVLRAAELYSWDRYRLDSVVVWPRLEATFDDGMPDPVLDSRTSLDLMVTLSAFSVLFGLPIAAGLALGIGWDVPWWLALAALVPAAILRLWAALVAAAAAAALAALELYGAALGALVVTAALLLAGLTYRNAVETALSFGEQIKATIDVHRWRVLRALKLPTPADIDQERELWTDVSGLLYRGYRPQSELYRYVTDDEQESAETAKKRA
jgi:hypothetical protein